MADSDEEKLEWVKIIRQKYSTKKMTTPLLGEMTILPIRKMINSTTMELLAQPELKNLRLLILMLPPQKIIRLSRR